MSRGVSSQMEKERLKLYVLLSGALYHSCAAGNPAPLPALLQSLRQAPRVISQLNVCERLSWLECFALHHWCVVLLVT